MKGKSFSFSHWLPIPSPIDIPNRNVSSVTFICEKGDTTIDFQEQGKQIILPLLAFKKRGNWKRYDRFMIHEIAAEIWVSYKVTTRQAVEKVEDYICQNHLRDMKSQSSCESQEDISLIDEMTLTNIHLQNGNCKLEMEYMYWM